MLSEKKAKFILKLILPVFIAVISIFFLADWVEDRKFVESTVESLDASKTTVMEFTGATMATSLAISALPDDFASPIANTLADMNKYFVFILMALFVERLVVVEGVKIVFVYLIPIACGLYVLGTLVRKEFLSRFANKLAVLSVAILLVIPFSTFLSNTLCAEYNQYVTETISETTAGADKINDAVNSDDSDATMFEKLSEAFKTAMKGMNDLLLYLRNSTKKCVNSIAILLVTTCVIPVLTLFFFKWLIKELFSISLPQFPGKPFPPMKPMHPGPGCPEPGRPDHPEPPLEAKKGGLV